MITATLEQINSEIVKYYSLAEGIGDIGILNSSKIEKSKVTSNELFFEDDNVHMYLTFHPNIKNKKVGCVFLLTDIDDEFVEELISRVGLPTTQENIENYKRDPSLIEKFWNDRFIKKYNEIMKYLRRSKVKYQFREKLPPVLKKNRHNEVVY